VFEVEAEAIRQSHGDLLATGIPHARGACTFLDATGACRIYASRPYVCRTQGLPLRWLVEASGRVLEHRDICPVNEAGPPVTHLGEHACWTIGPYENRLRGLQRARHGGALNRVPLRELFTHSAPAAARAEDNR
jgi:hypothetical protein